MSTLYANSESKPIRRTEVEKS